MKNDGLSCKVVIVGDSGVGKTCLIERYVHNRYEGNQKSTLVSSYTFKKVDIKEYNKTVSLDIWDTAGQEIYRSLSKNFYTNATIGILVYDICNIDTYNSIKEYWLEELKNHGDENMVLATRNLSNVILLEASEINVLDIISADYMVVTEKAIKMIEEVLV